MLPLEDNALFELTGEPIDFAGIFDTPAYGNRITIESGPELLNYIDYSDEQIESEECRQVSDQPDFDSIFDSVASLLSPSKKISKRKFQNFLSHEISAVKKQKKPIHKENAKNLLPFFEKWRELRKKDAILKRELKYWFSSFNLRLNKTYIYKDVFDKFRVHFRLVVQNELAFERIDEDSEWQNLFINLTEYLTDEVEKMKEEILKGKKCQVYPVWIENLNQFTVGKLSTHLE